MQSEHGESLVEGSGRRVDPDPRLSENHAGNDLGKEDGRPEESHPSYHVACEKCAEGQAECDWEGRVEHDEFADVLERMANLRVRERFTIVPQTDIASRRIAVPIVERVL